MAADFDENATKQMMVDIHHDPLDWIKKENIIPEEPAVPETLNIVIKKEFIAEGIQKTRQIIFLEASDWLLS